GRSVGLARWLTSGGESASTSGPVALSPDGAAGNLEVTGAGSAPLPAPITTSEKKDLEAQVQKTEKEQAQKKEEAQARKTAKEPVRKTEKEPVTPSPPPPPKPVPIAKV